MAEGLGGEVAALLEGELPLGEAARTAGYCDVEVTTATLGWFFAAARTIEGPPMSICSNAFVGSGTGCDGGLER